MGKLALALRLLRDQFLLLASLVLTVWIPGSLLINLAVAKNANLADSLGSMRMANLIEGVFGPIYTGAIITALAARMSGQSISYGQALRAGIHHWGRLFGARLVAGLIVLGGIIALIVPGIILAVRFSLIDEVVVLEGRGIETAPRRSLQLTGGKSFRILLACVLAIALIIGFAVLVGTCLELAGRADDPLVSACGDCLISVFAVFFTCLLFLYYWEARQGELKAELGVSLSEDEAPGGIVSRVACRFMSWPT
jgi:hypothetical protein